MAEIERKTKRYPSDLTDEEWSKIEPFLPGTARTGRRRQVDLREVLNAIRYLARTGCGWRIAFWTPTIDEQIRMGLIVNIYDLETV